MRIAGGELCHKIKATYDATIGLANRVIDQTVHVIDDVVETVEGAAKRVEKTLDQGTQAVSRGLEKAQEVVEQGTQMVSDVVQKGSELIERVVEAPVETTAALAQTTTHLTEQLVEQAVAGPDGSALGTMKQVTAQVVVESVAESLPHGRALVATVAFAPKVMRAGQQMVDRYKQFQEFRAKKQQRQKQFMQFIMTHPMAPVMLAGMAKSRNPSHRKLAAMGIQMRAKMAQTAAITKSSQTQPTTMRPMVPVSKPPVTGETSLPLVDEASRAFQQPIQDLAKVLDLDLQQ
ncbi:MAG: hypothetical protein HYZ47_04475 [Simkania negevensis]|nr:hypothetical protein [Simkania negevensis]